MLKSSSLVKFFGFYAALVFAGCNILEQAGSTEAKLDPKHRVVSGEIAGLDTLDGQVSRGDKTFWAIAVPVDTTGMVFEHHRCLAAATVGTSASAINDSIVAIFGIDYATIYVQMHEESGIMYTHYRVRIDCP